MRPNLPWVALIAAALALQLLIWPAITQAQQSEQDRIGIIKSATGTVWVVRTTGRIEVKAGDPLFKADSLEVDNAGTASVTLLDGTRLSIGESSTVWLDQFAYEPQNGLLGIVIRLVRGSMLFVTGEIGRLAPESICIETPNGSLGVRGTRFIARTAR